MTEVGAFTFLAQDDPGDYVPGGAAVQRSASLLGQAGELMEARKWAAQQVAKDAARRMERLAESLERPPTTPGIEWERCDAAALAYRESARIVREEGGVTDA